MEVTVEGNLVGKIIVNYQDPLTSQLIPIHNIDEYLKGNNSIAIYLKDDPVPYIMKMTYLKNILVDDKDFFCEDVKTTKGQQSKTFKFLHKFFHTKKKPQKGVSIGDFENPQYYNLRKLFLNTKEKPQIVVPIEEFNTCIKSTNRKITLYNTGNLVKLAPKTDISVIKKWSTKDDKEAFADIVKIYTSDGYQNINYDLIRLSEYRNKGHSFFNKLIFDLDNFLSNPPLKEANYSRATKYKVNEKVNEFILSIDYYFQKYGTKPEETKTYYRGMTGFYPYLQEIGDKMVLESYTSTSTESGSFQGQLVDVLYKVIVSNDIPRIDTLEDKDIESGIEYRHEKEVILPRNLIAELTHINDDKVPPVHTIEVTPLYKDQFDLKKENICKPFSVYKCEGNTGGGNGADYHTNQIPKTIQSRRNKRKTKRRNKNKNRNNTKRRNKNKNRSRK